MPLTLVTELLRELTYAIAPPRCLNCLQEVTWLCRACEENARFGELSCLVCKTKQPRGLTCRDCRQHTPVHGLITVDTYHAPYLRRGVHWLKFKRVREVAPILARLLIPRLSTIAPLRQLRQEALLVPIPLHGRRLRERGFNQSEDIARAISHYTGIPYANPLSRTRATYAQARLPEDLRHKNIHAAFTALPVDTGRLKATYLILLDDVATSGATITAAAQALRPHLPPGTQIWAAALARG